MDPSRDRYGRYLIPNQETGKPEAHTRVTTIAKCLDDTEALCKWKQRHVAMGLAARPDLFAVASAHSETDKSQLNKVCKDAIEASAASSRANMGTALHRFAERLDREEELQVPAPWSADIEAYCYLLDKLDIRIQYKYIEKIVVCPGSSKQTEAVAGTVDRIVEWNDENYILDIKTGRDLKYSWLSIAVQLAFYSRAKSIFVGDVPGIGYEHFPMPEVNQEKGIVLHLPAGEETCKAYLVNLDLGWYAATTALAVRQLRKNKDIAEPIV